LLVAGIGAGITGLVAIIAEHGSKSMVASMLVIWVIVAVAGLGAAAVNRYRNIRARVRPQAGARDLIAKRSAGASGPDDLAGAWDAREPAAAVRSRSRADLNETGAASLLPTDAFDT
jgi:hypothetical protein